MSIQGRGDPFIKELKEEPVPQVDAGFFRQVYGERCMYLSK